MQADPPTADAFGVIQPYTFQENAGARRFYERNGDKATECTDGETDEEKGPDVLYVFTGTRTEA